MYCPHCGTALNEGAKFCSGCGSPVAPRTSAPQAPTQPEGPAPAPVQPPSQPESVLPPPAASAPPAGAPALDAAFGVIGRWDWYGSARVALTLLFTSGVLALVVGIAARPAIPDVHYTTHTSIAWLIWLWTAVFGTHLTAGAAVVDAGGAHASGSVAAWPLTLTVLTFAAGLVVFRRATATITEPLAMLGFVVRTALMTAFPLLIVSFFGHVGVSDLLQLAGEEERAGQARRYVTDVSAGASSAGAFFMTFLVVAVVLLLASLTRPDVYGRQYERVRSWVAGAVRGAASLLVALIPAGLVAELVVWLMRPSGATGHITFHGAVNLVAGAVSYSANAGLAALSLGSLGSFGGSYDSTVVPGRSEFHSVWWYTGHGSYSGPVDHGFYVALVLAPLVLIAVAWAVSRSRAADVPARLAGWLVSLLVLLPLLMHFSGGRVHAVTDARDLISGLFGDDGFDSGDVSNVPGRVTGDMFGGVPTSSMWPVLLYAIIIGVIVAFATDSVSPEARARFRAGLAQLKPVQPAGQSGTPDGQQAPPVVYQVGDVVNGHRFDGTRWVPLE